ncbi:aminoacyl-histidine dipeptidase [Peptoniphilus sp. oral taxon 386]|uniref:aminoacyl-histidine dipeptidase n=1 Tax=Peptoniphilus sp. oral taxon 386 TaxID=652713 RepID=UPI0001DA9B54|nr:aminoacyl-histidine dipeptidase [Peptoniphilus sp. oral taxon 386]EFI42333.1 Xaa-His dipeptidase [Peptoniphilus sp. oral taxon 386 str. F0131]
MNKLTNLEPKRVFYYFEEITKVPRCSLKEEKIADYLENFAKSHNLKCLRDVNNNIVIKKDGSKGYENAPILIIQGHMDMVCEKADNCTINFDTDPIEFEVEGNIIIARETTLGADNGIAVAMALAILESDEIAHPPLEVLITTNEENGMTGAHNLDGKMLEGKMLLNLDSESEGVACVACAGGKRDILSFDKKFEKARNSREFYELTVTGLKGGHSGQEIKKGLGNSNKLMGRSLYEINKEFDIDLVDISGGAKPNAIPRLAKSIISIKPDDKKRIQDLIVKLNRNFVRELGKVDPDVRLNFEKTSNYESVLKTEIKENIINLLNILPNGVQSMSQDIDGLVGSSVNVGVIESFEDEIIITTNIRSALQSLRDEISDRHKVCAKVCNAEYSVQSEYPAWEYKDVSHLRDVAAKAYKEITGEELKLEAIHAGLECGLFKETIGDIDMLSIGPNIHGPHAPGENLEIESTNRVYNFVIEILKNLK